MVRVHHKARQSSNKNENSKQVVLKSIGTPGNRTKKTVLSVIYKKYNDSFFSQFFISGRGSDNKVQYNDWWVQSTSDDFEMDSNIIHIYY